MARGPLFLRESTSLDQVRLGSAVSWATMVAASAAVAATLAAAVATTRLAAVARVAAAAAAQSQDNSLLVAAMCVHRPRTAVVRALSLNLSRLRPCAWRLRDFAARHRSTAAVQASTAVADRVSATPADHTRF